MSLNLHGIVPACVTTFPADGSFDEASYRRRPAERDRVLRVAVEEPGDVPIVAGLSASPTEMHPPLIPVGRDTEAAVQSALAAAGLLPARAA
jgi:dihydrodipicolinate synthase/N-acetylneuraminate lyase